MDDFRVEDIVPSAYDCVLSSIVRSRASNLPPTPSGFDTLALNLPPLRVRAAMLGARGLVILLPPLLCAPIGKLCSPRPTSGRASLPRAIVTLSLPSSARWLFRHRRAAIGTSFSAVTSVPIVLRRSKLDGPLPQAELPSPGFDTSRRLDALTFRAHIGSRAA
ncbi:hypothetical protein DFH06DRAFT_1332730 [Mycena polygramma]|nr:hypothetical protein DFH06DRAFT_1332730 [Mycena polygramma]